MAIFCKHCHGLFNDLMCKPEQRCPNLTCVDYYPNTVYIDNEIAPFIKFFWDKGLRTIFSCGGHVLLNEQFLFKQQEKVLRPKFSVPYIMFRFDTPVEVACFYERFSAYGWEYFTHPKEASMEKQIDPEDPSKYTFTITLHAVDTQQKGFFLTDYWEYHRKFYTFLSNIVMDLTARPWVKTQYIQQD